jgi:hypothetical protein
MVAMLRRLIDAMKDNNDDTLRRKDAVQNNILWYVRWQAVVQTTNLMSSLIVIALLFTVGLGSEAVEDVKMSAKNVRTITGNLIPISEATASATHQNQTGNVTLAGAVTDALIAVAFADWKATMGNASLAMGAVSKINYKAVTDLFIQAQDPETQAEIKRQIIHALSSFDFASAGLTKVISTFENGIAARFNTSAN